MAALSSIKDFPVPGIHAVSMTDLSPWLMLIALGAFHGLNPAMGWLFAVALGLYRKAATWC